MKFKYKRDVKHNRLRKGFLSLETAIIGGIILVFTVMLAIQQIPMNQKHMVDGSVQLSDNNKASMIINQGSLSKKITYLAFNPATIEINPRETRKVPLIIRPDVDELWRQLNFENTNEAIIDHTFAYNSGSPEQLVTVVGKTEGVTTLKVNSTDGGGATATLTVKVGWKLNASNLYIETDKENPKSTEEVKATLLIRNSNATLKNKEITWQVQDVTTEFQGMPATGGSSIVDFYSQGRYGEEVILQPKQGGKIILTAKIYDPLYNMNFEIVKEITFTQQWAPETDIATQCKNEKNELRYRSYDYLKYTSVYTTPLNKVGEQKVTGGYRYPIKEYETVFSTVNPSPNDPGIKVQQQYNKMSIVSWNAWTRGTTVALGAQTGTDYCYKTRSKVTEYYGCNVSLGTVGQQWGYPSCSGGFSGQWWSCNNGCNPDVNWGCAGGCTFYRSGCVEYRSNGCSRQVWGAWSAETGCRVNSTYGYASCSTPGESASCQVTYEMYRTPNMSTTATWYDCASTGCPTNTSVDFYTTREVYYKPIQVVWSEWQKNEIVTTANRFVETKTVYLCPLSVK